MYTTIFYFSGTGNSLKIARDLAEKIGDAEVISIAKAIKSDANITSSRVGFVFPVYAFTVPLIVSDFLGKLNVPKGTYVFAVTTCANVAANVLDQMKGKLKKKGLKLSSGFIIKMPSNYTPFGEAAPAEKQQKLFAKELEKVKEIAEIVKENRVTKIENSKLPLRLIGTLLSPLMRNVMRKEDKNFWITDACNGCGLSLIHI